MKTPLWMALALVGSTLLTACNPGDEDPYDGTGEASEAVAFDCGTAELCSGTGASYGTTYRVGTGPTTRGELVQTFRVATAGQLTSLGVIVTKLRAFTSPSAVLLHAEVYEVTSGEPQLDSLSPITTGTVDLASPATSGQITIGLTAVAVAPAQTYAVRFYTDALPSGSTGDLLIGIAVRTDSNATFQNGEFSVYRRGTRRTGPSASFGAGRFRAAGPWDLAVAFSIASAPAAPTVPTAGLVLRWKIDEGSGTTLADDTGHGRTGTIQNATWATTGCKFGSCLQFTTSSGSAYNATTISNPSGLTFAGWFNLDGATGDYQGFFNDGVNCCQYRLLASPGLNPFWDAGQYTDVSFGSYTFPSQQWVHVVWTLAPFSAKLWVDGALVAQTSSGVPGTLPSVPLFKIGSANNNQHPLSGRVNDVLVYDRVLSDAEIGGLFASY